MQNLPNMLINQGRDMSGMYNQMGNRYLQSSQGYGQLAGQMFGKVFGDLFGKK
jgi:hypothetical protein